MTAPRAILVVDLLLALMVLIWGVNFSVLKVAFREIPAAPFNAVRLALAVAVFLGAIAAARRGPRHPGDARTVRSVFVTDTPVTARDVRDLVLLGLVGHFLYQIGFVGGVAATSVSNAALIIGTTPVVVTCLAAAIGRERLSPLHWAGVVLSLVGIYFVVGVRSSFGGASVHGDLLMAGSVLCWSAYTVGAGRLMARHSPLFVTGVTMAIGMVPYVIWAGPAMRQVDWTGVSAWTWGALVFSALFALNVCYLIWYIAVRQIGPSRTAIVSNLVPIAAMIVAAVWLREPVTRTKVAGAVLVLAGVALTRRAGRGVGRRLAKL
ncbi:MAG: DMT family transporter [Vicinamibacterales bacterium]